tara:strand:- start:251 stop:385 length:135 start_codon:yes stop_codon:yes gene_type:complete
LKTPNGEDFFLIVIALIVDVVEVVEVVEVVIVQQRRIREEKPGK